MKETVYQLLVAFQFLTRIPISGLPRQPQALARAARFFPVVGLAIGLVAAIPAQVFYNYLTGRVHVLATDIENFISEFLNIAERHFLS